MSVVVEGHEIGPVKLETTNKAALKTVFVYLSIAPKMFLMNELIIF
jgi:hypothetical protein